MRSLLSACCLLAMTLSGEALPEDRGAAGLRHALKQLSTDVHILYVTAHPDDEDPALLTYLSRGLGANVTMLILNRGEGGANVVSGDFFEALGVLRTAEMMQAARYYGVAVRFTRAVDYGFSKNIGEALRQWNEADLLDDVLSITRQVKPHIIISRFNESERDGHGHHQTAGRMARRAFREAAIDGWRPLKLYTTNWREVEPVTLKINTGQYDPMLGRSFSQIGRDGYRWHRSQGMAANVARPGPVWSYLKLEGSSVGPAESEASILDRIELPPPDPLIANLSRNFDATHPERSAPDLALAWQKLPQRRASIEKALILALGLEFEALIEPDAPPAPFRSVETLQVAQPGQRLKARMILHQRGTEAITSVEYGVKGPIAISQPDAGGVYPLKILPHAKPTAAFWSRASVRDAMYRLAEPSLLGKPTPESEIRATASFVYRGASVTIESDFETSSAGAQRQPLAIGPPVSVQFSSSFGMAPIGKRDYELSVTLRNLSTVRQQGVLRLRLPAGFTTNGTSLAFDLGKEKEEARFRFAIRLPERLDSRDYPITAVAEVAGQQYAASFKPISQPGLRVLYWSEPAVHNLRAVDVKVVSGLKVGYVMGSGDEVPEGLRQLGLPVDLLSEASLATGDLNRYSTILIGIRAYAAREDIKRHNARLLDYVNQGGVLIVQYQTQEYDKNFGPFPYTQGRGAEEVSEEDAAVTILAPDRDVFQRPNRISAADFAGWVEQRGSKFFSTWAPQWQPLIETHDQGQPPQKGVWLEARSGKGLYVYCSLAWYRQLPYAVPGAARLVANLVSLGAADAAWRKASQ